jgi:hypothetical protein
LENEVTSMVMSINAPGVDGGGGFWLLDMLFKVPPVIFAVSEYLKSLLAGDTPTPSNTHKQTATIAFILSSSGFSDLMAISGNGPGLSSGRLHGNLPLQ